MDVKYELDSKDLRILDLLLNNARLSNKEIAVATDLAQSSAHDRIKKLTKRGFFKGFHAQLDRKKLGMKVEVMIAVKLSQHHRKVIDEFMEKATQLPGLLQFFHMAGSNDFLLHIAVRDADELRSFILDKLATLDYIGHVQTDMVFYSKAINNLALVR